MAQVAWKSFVYFGVTAHTCNSTLLRRARAQNDQTTVNSVPEFYCLFLSNSRIDSLPSAEARLPRSILGHVSWLLESSVNWLNKHAMHTRPYHCIQVYTNVSALSFSGFSCDTCQSTRTIIDSVSLARFLCNSKLAFHGSEICKDVTVAMHAPFCCLLDRVEKNNVFKRLHITRTKTQLKYLRTARRIEKRLSPVLENVKELWINYNNGNFIKATSLWRIATIYTRSSRS